MRGLSLVEASGGHSSLRCTGLSLSQPLLLRSTGSRRAGSVVVAHGPSCSAACGILPDQGSNPCPLHWQADSQPLRHQGSPLHLFLLLFLLLWETDLRKHCYNLSETVLPMFSSRSFMVTCLIFKSLSLLSLFLCMLWGSVLTSLIYMQLSSFPNTTCWRDCLFSIVYSCLLCWRVIDCKCVGLFLGSLFCSIDPYACFCPNTTLFWLL